MSKNENKLPSESIEFPLNELDKAVIDMIPLMPPPPRWPAFNAIRHLNRAWRIREVDPEMAYFRAITAKEEAATALFQSLKRRHYPDASKLRNKDHVHKNAVFPFIKAISKSFAQIGNQLPHASLLLDKKDKPYRLQLYIRLPNSDVRAFPQPPLNFSKKLVDSEGTEIEYNYDNEMNQLVEQTNADSIIKYLDEIANMRNRLLYAASEGYPGLSGNIEAALKRAQQEVLTVLKIYLLVDPYNERQGFVVQCLSSFLKILGLMPSKMGFQ